MKLSCQSLRWTSKSAPIHLIQPNNVTRSLLHKAQVRLLVVVRSSAFCLSTQLQVAFLADLLPKAFEKRLSGCYQSHLLLLEYFHFIRSSETESEWIRVLECPAAFLQNLEGVDQRVLLIKRDFSITQVG